MDTNWKDMYSTYTCTELSWAFTEQKCVHNLSQITEFSRILGKNVVNFSVTTYPKQCKTLIDHMNVPFRRLIKKCLNKNSARNELSGHLGWRQLWEPPWLRPPGKITSNPGGPWSYKTILTDHDLTTWSPRDHVTMNNRNIWEPPALGQLSEMEQRARVPELPD